jgi:hypothetical protein
MVKAFRVRMLPWMYVALHRDNIPGKREIKDAMKQLRIAVKKKLDFPEATV